MIFSLDKAQLAAVLDAARGLTAELRRLNDHLEAGRTGMDTAAAARDSAARPVVEPPR